jgi:hypothetical protein
MEPPDYQVRGGDAHILHDPEADTFHFVYMATSGWVHDTWTSTAILNRTMRFYQLVNPHSWYRGPDFATVADSAIYARFTLLENPELLTSIRSTAIPGVSRMSVRQTSAPPDDDSRFRDHREGRQITHDLFITRYRPPTIIIPPYEFREETQTQRGPQKRVAELVIANAVDTGTICPITMDPLTVDTAACVAPCYHVFEQEAIRQWLVTQTTCPECREPCAL